MPPINKKDNFKSTHRVLEHELLQRLERLCETAGLEFPNFLEKRGRKMTTKHIFFSAYVLLKI